MAGVTLVVGANRGIGLALVQQLHARGDTVVATCRTPSAGLQAVGVEVVEGVDVTRDEGLQALSNALQGRSVQQLIHNAGVLSRETLTDLDAHRIRWQFEVNALAPLRTIGHLVHHLGQGAKVGILTSRMGSIADNTSGGAYGYRMSKAAVNAAGVSLAHDLAPRGVALALLHPGYVRTDMTGGNGYVDPDHAARGLIARMDELTLDTTGRFWHADGPELPW